MAELKIHFLGTGNAFHLDGRGSQCLWFESEGRAPFLVDAGPTAVSSIERCGLDCQSIDRLFLTHLHGDHTAGWPFLLLHLAILGERRRPFDVFGPAGVEERLDGLARLCFEEIVANPPFEIRFHEWPVESRRDVDGGPGVSVDMLPMQHHRSSLGLRFRLQQRRIAVSGDTGWCSNLESLGRDSDLLIVECTTTRRDSCFHLSLEEIRERRERLGCDEILLVHLCDAVATELGINPIPGVTAAYDGLTWSSSG